ncbi:stage III sporulation protein AE [Lutispora saccharofermentans]|uniref:Stage III sporulation protein AE n=1 Tax=Lutispora saccharofermentans TaxID=3024236 RepID=A0ABT1NF06_9FIRM|nr:stage III sporulation protein AE [Lutispora saccharofermentans]MCQ1529822.1 stage III sporulation protein AE [Lutispora saccharofermentans]
MRRRLFLICLLIFLTLGSVHADGMENLLDEQLNQLNLDEIQRFADDIVLNSEGMITEISIKEIIKSVYIDSGSLSLKAIFSKLWLFLWRELAQNLDLLGKIMILSVFCAILQNLHAGFDDESVGKIAYSVCYVLIIILAIGSFSIVSKLCINTIDKMVSFMQSLLPTLITLLLSVGGITSSSLFQPIVYTSLTLIATIIKITVIPMVMFSAVLSIVSNISEKIKISKLASLVRGVAVGMLGIMLTIFTGIISVQGLASSSLDGLAAKTAKFAVDSFVPIIGDFLSEAFDTVISCSLIIKNGISIAGLFIILMICLFPLIKIFSIFAIYKVSGALIQPIVDNELVQCINDISTSIFIMLCCVVSVGILFFISITVIMGIGNMTVMMR